MPDPNIIDAEFEVIGPGPDAPPDRSARTREVTLRVCCVIVGVPAIMGAAWARPHLIALLESLFSR